MCRNIRTLANFDPPATQDEIRASALQFVRKLSGSNRPSRVNEDAFNRAVEEVGAAAERLIRSLQTNAPPRDRDVEREKLREMRVEVAMMRTPDGHSRLELSRFLAPAVVADHRTAPVNALGYLRVMFTVDDIDDTLARLRKHGAEVVGEVVQYENAYRLCYIRGPEKILIGIAQELGEGTS